MSTMNKLKLNVEELAVHSFEASLPHENTDWSLTTTEIRPCHA